MICRNYVLRETVADFSEKPKSIWYTVAKGLNCCHTVPMISVSIRGFTSIIFYTSSHFLAYCKAQNIKISDFPEEFSSKISTLKVRPPCHTRMYSPGIEIYTDNYNQWKIKKI